MTSQRIVNDVIAFDWNVVAAIDPDYTKYLYDLNEQNHTYEEDGSSLLADVERARWIEPDEDIIYANPQRVPPPRMSCIETDEELEIIQQVTGCKADKPATHQDDPTSTMLEGLGEINETWGRPKHIHRYWELQRTYEELKGQGPIPTVPLLMPPKRFLATGSVLHYPNGQQDNIDPSIYDHTADKGINTLLTRKVAVSHDGVHVRLIYISYHFDKIKNVTSKKKKNVEFLTFNRKRGMIFRTFYEETTKSKRSKRYRRKVMSCNFSLMALNASLSRFKDTMIRKFTDEIVMMAYKDLGDLYLPPPKNCVSGLEYCALVLNAVMWQYKARRPLPWADNKLFLENLSHIISLNYMRRSDFHTDHIHNAMMDAEPAIERKWRQKRLLHITKAVRNSDSPKAVIKSILGNTYKSVYAKMLLELTSQSMEEFSFIPIIEALLRDKQIPKSFYHALASTVKGLNSNNISWIKEMVSVTFYWERFTTNPNHRLYGWVEKYVALNNKFTTNGDEPVGWNHLRDTLVMAEDYNIRVRINKFNRPADITHLHNQLSEFTRRDNKALRTAPVFLPFDHPDKEYDGFRFVHLDTAEKLVEEGTCMKHCVGGYASRCFKGESIIFTMQKGRSWVTIELDGSTNELKINQQYTIGDNAVNSDHINQIINQWHRDVLDMHRCDAMPYQTLADHVREIIKIRQTKAWFESNNESVAIDGETMMHDVPKLTAKIEGLFNELAKSGIPVEMVKSYVETIEQPAAKTQQQRFPLPTTHNEGNALPF